MVDIAPWLRLYSVPGVGDLLFRRLIDGFGTPSAVLNSNVESLCRIKGISKKTAEAIAHHPDPDWALKEMDRISKAGIQTLTLTDERYPSLLRQLPDPPPLLFYNGSVPDLERAVAIVGSRKATSYGLKVARELGKALTEHGFVVVSGMALGIDTAAHQGALAGCGPTVAVLGSGLNHIYPTQNLQLSRQIANNGCVITELPIDAKPEPHHFPKRNRIISGMSLGTVVVEATKKSGSLITARLAAEQNREVFAVPGSIQAGNARGPHELIRQGAKLVETVDDIIEEIAPQLVTRKEVAETNDDSQTPSGLTEEEATTFALLGPYPIHIDTLARRLKVPIGRLNGTLSLLELKGLITQEPGKLFLRAHA